MHLVSSASGDDVATIYMVNRGSRKDEEFRIQRSLAYLFWKYQGQELGSKRESFAGYLGDLTKSADFRLKEKGFIDCSKCFPEIKFFL